MPDIQNISKSQLLDDLAFMRDHRWLTQKIVDYNEDYAFYLTLEEAKERVADCYKIISEIVFEIVRRNAENTETVEGNS